MGKVKDGFKKLPMWVRMSLAVATVLGLLFGNGFLSVLAGNFVNQKVMKTKIAANEESIQKTDDTLDSMNDTLHEHDTAIEVQKTQLKNMNEKLDDIGGDLKFLVREAISSSP